MSGVPEEEPEKGLEERPVVSGVILTRFLWPNPVLINASTFTELLPQGTAVVKAPGKVQQGVVVLPWPKPKETEQQKVM